VGTGLNVAFGPRAIWALTGQNVVT